jgi:hypothetical protein
MRVVHIAINPEYQPSKRGKLANDKQALQAGLLAWKLKHNAKIEKQQNSK